MKPTSLTRPATLLVLLLGLILRFYHLFKIDFIDEPFRLGGLFVAFAEQINLNNFRLPVSIPYYSSGGIPFAYPPLGFYLEALLLRIFPAGRFVIANLLPPALSALALLAVFLLLRRLHPQSEAHVLAGLFAYACLPLAFANQIEAAGLAESLGSLLLVLYFGAALGFHQTPNLRNALLAGLALGLCVLASPGGALGAALLSGLLALALLLRTRFAPRSIGLLGVFAGSGLLLSAPYWATVMHNHGRGIFILPVLAQYTGGAKQGFLQTLLLRALNFNLVQDGAPFFWNLLIFLGLLWLLSRRKFALPLAFLALISVPREYVWLTALPAALLFAYGLVDALPTLLGPALQGRQRSLLLAGLSLLCVWVTFQSFALIDSLIADQQWKLSAAQVEALESARALIPADAQVFVLGNDALLEWAPLLLQREVLNTKFGLEWQPAEAARILVLNNQAASAKNWEDILQALRPLTLARQVYVISTSKKDLTALSRDNSVPFRLKLETPVLQLGLLGAP